MMGITCCYFVSRGIRRLTEENQGQMPLGRQMELSIISHIVIFLRELLTLKGDESS